MEMLKEFSQDILGLQNGRENCQLRKTVDLAESNLPASSKNIHTYTQALMDLGSTVCKKRTQPLCDKCPSKSNVLAMRKT